MDKTISDIIFDPKYEINEFAKDKNGKWDSVQDGKVSLYKELISSMPHSDKTTESYCETLQRENQYLRDKLSTRNKKMEELVRENTELDSEIRELKDKLTYYHVDWLKEEI